MTSSLLVAALGSLGWAQEKTATFPPLPARYITIKVFDNQGRFVGRLLPEKRYWVSIDRIPPFLQKALVAIDIQALIRLSGKKENRLSRIQALDSLLADLTAEFRPATHATTARLGALIPLLNPEEGKKLDQYRKKLTGLREEILRRNQINGHFAEDVKIYLNDAISLITSGIADRPMYGLTGRNRKPSLSQPSLISREV